VVLPPLIVFGLFRAIASASRRNAEAKIRETEARLKEEELRGVKLRNDILECVRDTVREASVGGALRVPDEVLVAAANVSSPAIADLSSNPLIEKVTIGFSGDGKAA
jgi:hypothetical protein